MHRSFLVLLFVVVLGSTSLGLPNFLPYSNRVSGPGILTKSSMVNQASTSLQQAVLWQGTWGGGGEDYGRAVVDDLSGNTFVTGYTYSFGAGSQDLTLLKYNSSGDLVWAETWGGSGNDAGYGIALDSTGSVYLTGHTDSFGAGRNDAVILKFNSTGGIVWQRNWGGQYDDYGWGIAVDPSGYVYVTGETYSFGSNAPSYNDIFIIKLDPSGNLIWQTIWGSSIYDGGQAVAVDPTSGSIYVAGYAHSCGAGSNDAVLLKLNENGNLLWQKAWGGSNVDVARGITIDRSGNVYLTGYTQSLSSSTTCGTGTKDAFLLEFDSLGGLLLQEVWQGRTDSDGYGVALDSLGGVRLAGETVDPSGGLLKVLLLNLNSTGGLVSANTWGGNGNDEGFGVAVNSQGYSLVTGVVDESSPYSVGNATGSIILSAITTYVPGYNLGTPAGTVGNSAGTVSRPVGSQVYGGASDAFLLAYGPRYPPQYFGLDWADHDNNGVVDIADLASVANCFGTDSSSPYYMNCKYWDLYLTGKVDIADIANVALLFGRQFNTTPYPGQGLPAGMVDPYWFTGGTCGLLSQPFQKYCLALSTNPNFTLSVASPNVIQPGGSGEVTVTVDSLNGFTGNVTLFATDPVGFSHSFSVDPVTGFGTSTLNITVAASVSPGTYEVNVTASAGTISHSTVVSVSVQPFTAHPSNIAYSVATYAFTEGTQRPDVIISSVYGVQGSTYSPLILLIHSTDNATFRAIFTYGGSSPWVNFLTPIEITGYDAYLVIPVNSCPNLSGYQMYVALSPVPVHMSSSVSGSEWSTTAANTNSVTFTYLCQSNPATTSITPTPAITINPTGKVS